jgi:hypothetical protein
VKNSSLAYVADSGKTVIKVDNGKYPPPSSFQLSVIYANERANGRIMFRFLSLSTSRSKTSPSSRIATFVPWNEKRNSVKLKSDDWYKPGTVMVLDATQ